MLGVPGEDDVMLRAARHDPQLMSDQLLRAWLDFLRAEAEALPILLLIEDMHWGDNASLQFLDAALGALADKPFFILGMARPELWERAPELWNQRDLASIELPPLSPEASTQFAHQTLGPEVDQERLSHLCGLAGGNPFYLEELLRGMASGRAEFPETVLAMIQGGFQELPEEARRALRAASVFGHEFWLGGVAALLGQEDRAPLRALLHRLVDEQILVARQDSRFHGEEEFAFWQSLLREAAYAALTEANRTVGHRLAAEWLEQRGESAPGVLAGHHERGGQRDRAIKYYAEAAYQALSANDLAGALAHVARGVECGAEGEALGKLRLIEAEVHNWRAEFAQAEPRSLEALRLLPRGRADWFRAISETVIAAGRLGHHEQLVAIAKTLLAVRWDATRSAAPLIAASRAVPRLMFAAQRPLATQLLEQIAKLELSIVEDPLAEPWFKMALASASMISGDRSQFIYYIQDTIRGFERLGDQRTACLQRMDLGFGLFQIADYAGVVTTLSQVIKEAERLNLRRIPGAAMRALCPALARIGRVEEAKDVARHAISLLSAQGDLQQASSVRIHLAQLHALSNRWELAREEILAALANLITMAPVRPHALATLARIELRDQKVAEALRYATEAMRLFKPMSGVDAGETLVRLVYAEALLASGQQDAARAAAQDALRYLTLRAQSISTPEHRDAFLQKIPESAQTLAFARSLGIEV
jgi:tetratricopeptide (TPR) repeat protein